MSRRHSVQEGGTGELRKAARAFKTAERKLATAMLEAHEAGSSLRTISLDTGFSHEKVRAMIAAERRRVVRVEERIARGPVGLSFAVLEQEKAHLRSLARTLPVKKSDG